MSFGKARKIFIVDDDPMFTEALQDYLTRKVPHRVSVFSTGEECLQHLADKPDVIVLDYYLNSVNKDAASGLEILPAIKKSYPEIYVIMLSGQEHYGIALKTIQKGAAEYVIKGEDAFEKVAKLIAEMD